MKTATLTECKDAYKNLLVSDRGPEVIETAAERENTLKSFPHSVIVESSFLEHDEAIRWGEIKFGVLSEDTSGKWKELWYAKTGYDYGFWEFFFKDNDDCLAFEKEMPNFFATVDGKKWRTEGVDTHIDVL
jgi:hypothetical protein